MRTKRGFGHVQSARHQEALGEPNCVCGCVLGEKCASASVFLLTGDCNQRLGSILYPSVNPKICS